MLRKFVKKLAEPTTWPSNRLFKSYSIVLGVSGVMLLVLNLSASYGVVYELRSSNEKIMELVRMFFSFCCGGLVYGIVINVGGNNSIREEKDAKKEVDEGTKK